MEVQELIFAVHPGMTDHLRTIIMLKRLSYFILVGDVIMRESLYGWYPSGKCTYQRKSDYPSNYGKNSKIQSEY